MILLIALGAACLFGAAAVPSPQEPMRFANPQLLVDTRWLAEHLQSDDVRVVDAREAKDYAAGHLPRAVSVPRSATFDPEGAGSMAGSAERIAALFGAQGIDASVHVVVYDEGRGTAAARVFWTLEYYGHPKVSVLDGGFAKWSREEREVTQETPATKPVELGVRPVPRRLSTKAEVLADLGAADAVLVDARSDGEYTGRTVRSERGGHVPGAVHIEWTRNFTEGEVPVFRSAAELSKLYQDAGVTLDKRAHVYCQTAQRSSVAYLALRLLGHETPGNYDGSWQEWGDDPDVPIEK